MPDDTAAVEVAALAERCPELVALARMSSIAAVVEPPLLRRLRLQLGGLAAAALTVDIAPGAWHAGLEADLWFSRLTHVATPTQMTLRPAVLEVLRHQLGENRNREVAQMARLIVADTHRGHSDMVRLEEEIVWSTVCGEGDAVEAALARVLATLKTDPERAIDVIRWFTQARRRLPASALQRPTGRRLLAALAMHLDRVLPAELLAANQFPDEIADLAPDTLPASNVGVILTANGVRFTGSTDAHAGQIPVPETRPRVVEVSWPDDQGEQNTALVPADEGSATALPGLAGQVVLRTISGRRFGLRSAQTRRIMVAVFGSHPAWKGVGDVGTFLTSKVAERDVEVHVVHEPSDVFVKAEIVVFGRGINRESFRSFRSGFSRAMARGAAGGAAFLVTEAVASTERVELDWEDPGGVNLLARADIFDEPEITDAVVTAIRRVLASPVRVYELNVDPALTMLSSVALAFHVRAFYADDLPDEAAANEAAENRLFELPHGDTDDSLERQTFYHVRALCEWLFDQPVRDYLAGAADPALDGARMRNDPGWAPPGQQWASFAAYLDWFVTRLRYFFERMRDQLEPKLIRMREVPIDVLEAARLAAGTRPLPLVQGLTVSYSDSGSNEMPTAPFAVERVELPELLDALAPPVLVAVREEATRRKRLWGDSSADMVVRVLPSPGRSGSGDWHIRMPDVEDSETTEPGTLSKLLELCRDAPSILGAGRESPLALSAIGELGQRMSSLIPQAFWSRLESSADAVRPRSPTVQFVTEFEMPLQIVIARPAPDSRVPPYLGCQAALATSDGRPSRAAAHSSLTVSQVAVIAGDDALKLPGVDAEISELADHFQTRHIPTQLDAMIHELSTNLGIGVLHVIGTTEKARKDMEHALDVEDDRLNPRLLAPSDLRAVQMASTPVVFVSADNATDLARAFYKAGAAGVVVPMWRVPDRQAREFTRRFYRGALEEGAPIAEVLRRLRCENDPLGTAALAYHFIGDVSLTLRWQPTSPQ